MREVAYVGQIGGFMCRFDTLHSPYIDRDNDTIYHCISSEYDARGRIFDEVIFGTYNPTPKNDTYYHELYEEIVGTRLRGEQQ